MLYEGGAASFRKEGGRNPELKRKPELWGGGTPMENRSSTEERGKLWLV